MGEVTAEKARQQEITFLGRFDQAVRRLDRVRSPVDGRWIRVPDWTAIHRDEPGLLPIAGAAAVVKYGGSARVFPHNLTSVYDVGAKGSSFALVAAFYSHMAAFGENGIDNRPVSDKECAGILEEAVGIAKVRGVFHVLGLASPTGFAPSVEEAVTGSTGARSFSSDSLAICLVDLSRAFLIYNRADSRIADFVGLFSGETEPEAVVRAADHIRSALLLRESLTVHEVAAATGVTEQLVLQVFKRLETEGEFLVDELKGRGRIISKRI